MHDEIKISWLQAQLQVEKQQRAMDALKHKLENKMEEVSRKILQSVDKSVDELKQQQKLLMYRQDQLFSKQDQIQSTLANDSASVTSVTWPNIQYPMPMSSGMQYNEPQLVAGGSTSPFLQPMPRTTQLQSVVSDIESFNISDTDLESLLSFDWDCPQETGKEADHMQPPPDEATANESTCEDNVSLVDPKLIIKNNSHFCNVNDVGKLANILARDSYFGINILCKSTLGGKGGQQALDSAKISSLLSVIHNDAAFSELSKEEFSKLIKPKVLGAIRHQCKYWRAKKKQQ